MKNRTVRTYVVLAAFFIFSHTLSAQSVPAGGEFEMEIDETIAIYGQRAKDCKDAPEFKSIIKTAVSRKPKYGTLSDGGVGERYSGSCKKEVPVRIINYTPDQEKVLKRAKKKNKTVIKDRISFWGSDKATILIETE